MPLSRNPLSSTPDSTFRSWTWSISIYQLILYLRSTNNKRPSLSATFVMFNLKKSIKYFKRLNKHLRSPFLSLFEYWICHSRDSERAVHRLPVVRELYSRGSRNHSYKKLLNKIRLQSKSSDKAYSCSF